VFSPGRLVFAAVLAGCVYFGFFAVPPGPRAEGQFDPARLASSEVELWKAARGHEEFGVYMSLVSVLREQHRYSWFRAAQASYYLGRATTAFVDMRGRYEHLLPDLEDAATIERDWMQASFDPTAVARAQLTWWVTRRMPNLNSVDQIAPLIADDYALRYDVPARLVMDAAQRRATALNLAETGGLDPDWATVTSLLTESNRALQQGLSRAHAAQ
jgi:hypothetical protein